MLIIMEREIAAKEAKKRGTDIVNIVREYWEVILLKYLFESPYGKDIVFKGGTALRLVYGSPRYSEDLDFSLLENSIKKKFSSLIRNIISPFPELQLTDCIEKYYTYLAEVKVSVNYISMPFRIKIEISKRRLKSYKWELKVINSPLMNLQVLVQVASLEQLYKDKLACIKTREKPKDIFDFWYISQQLKVSFNAGKINIPDKVLKRDLRKYLPKNYWQVIEKLKQ